MINLRILFSVSLCVVLLFLGIACNSDEQITNDPSEPEEHGPNWDVTVTIDPSAQYMISNFEIGLTHTNSGWEWGSSEAVDRVKALLEDGGIRYQNTHIMGWGPGNPNPEPGVYSWGTLDSRMDLIMSMEDVEPVITLCQAPGWMKESGEDWSMEERVTDEHVDDFAELSAEVAARYRDVKYFQVWNELKGYRSWPNGEVRDMERFTEFYNAVYDAVKEVRPDAKIGGPYIPMGGPVVSVRHKEDIAYWYDNSNGVDFFTFDDWLEGYHDQGTHTEEWMMDQTSIFGDIAEQLREVVNLPMWVSEHYPGRSDSEQFIAVNHASTYYHSLKSDTRMALLWSGDGLGELFSGTGSADGGQPTPHYAVVKAFNNYFGSGRVLYEAESSSDDLEVLASQEKTMLINKLPDSVTVNLNGEELSLEGYEVRVMDIP